PPRLTNSLGMELVRIPAGKFRMGSLPSEPGRGDDEDEHEVEITRPFYLGAYEVTQAQYEKIMGHNPSWFHADGGGGRGSAGLDTAVFPVEYVRWSDAVEFCKRLSARPEERRLRRTYRLPTEAEWEYACRAGTTAPFHHGPTLDAAQANFDGAGLKRTARVGSYSPNACGLYDMHGNVWEWCADWYEADFYRTGPRRGPTCARQGSQRGRRRRPAR